MQEISKQAQQEAAKKDEEQQEQLTRDKFCFLVDRLKADIRYFIHCLEEWRASPMENVQDAWKQHVAEMAEDLGVHDGAPLDEKGGASQGGGSGISLDPIVALLNYRDRILACIVGGALYHKAVLNNGHDIEPTKEGGGFMVELQEEVARVLREKPGQAPPDMWPVRTLPTSKGHGHFTYEKRKQQGDGVAETSQFHSRLLVVLRETQGLHRQLRQIKFGKKINMSSRDKPSSAEEGKPRSRGGEDKPIATQEIRVRIGEVYVKCCRLEHELQMSKAQRHAALDVQAELHQKRIQETDLEYQKHHKKVTALQTDVTAFKNESEAIRREKVELADKHMKMAAEHLPELDKVDKSLGVLRADVDQFTADAEMLSQMLRLQVDEHRKVTGERDERQKELQKIKRVLNHEQRKNDLKDVELGKKETLYQRTLDARQATHETYSEGKGLIRQAEERLQKKQEAWAQMQQEVARRQQQVQLLKDTMRRAVTAIDELEQQKKECMKEFKAATGRPYAVLLKQRAEPVAPGRAGYPLA